MRLFRRSLDLSLATPRAGTPDDLTAVQRLLRNSVHRYTSYPSPHLPSLLAGAPAIVLSAGREIWGAAVAGWSIETSAWIRVLTLADGMFVGPSLDMLMPAFHELLLARQVQHLFYAGDEAADRWVQPSLLGCGYMHETDVVVYEKTDMAVPAAGNPAVRLRHAEAVDLPVILAIDRDCFAAQWNKDESALGPALCEVPYFVVAELAGQTAGYAFATTHFAGRLVHLVRIAVLPSFRSRAIGVRLLADVVEFARGCGAETLTLNTQAHNTQAQRLYEWFGFRRTGEQQVVLRYDLALNDT
jgi:ribosomal protein S18 acetylase RimI-like enzyme